MLKGGIMTLVVSVSLAPVSLAGPFDTGNIADIPEGRKGEARWARAERDKANAVLAKDFVRGERAPKSTGSTTALPNAVTGDQQVK
jgi:hypothetical protein